MMMERRDTQILSDLPPRCDVDDDDDDASIVVVVLSEEEDRHGRRSPPRTSTRSVPFFERRLQKGYDRSSLENHRRDDTSKRGRFFFSQGEAPLDDKTKFVSLVRKKKRERDREIRTFTDATPPLAATDDDILLVLLLLLFLNESLTNDALVVVFCRVSSSSSSFLG